MQTANDSMDPRSVLEQLERLKSAVSSVVSAEQALMKSKAERLARLRRDAQQHSEAEAGKLDIRIHKLTAEFNDAAEDVHAAMEARSAMIHRAYHASKASLSRRIEQRKDHKIARVQGDIMRNRHARQHELDQAVMSHQAFMKLLNVDRVLRRNLRKSVLSTFRGFKPWVILWFNGRIGKFPKIDILATAEETRAALVKRLEEAEAVADAAGRLPREFYCRLGWWRLFPLFPRSAMQPNCWRPPVCLKSVRPKNPPRGLPG